jgi:hypothetical protein
MSVDPSPNPYDSPRGLEEPHSWWSWLREFFSAKPVTFAEQLLSGARTMFHGVVFRIKPDDPESLFALMPLGAREPQRVRNNVLEAQRVLFGLIGKYPELLESLYGRQLVVVLITEYGTNAEEICRETVPAGVWHAWKAEDWPGDEEPGE